MRGIALYTGLRLALLVAVWLLIQAVTPLRGLIAAGAAIVVSAVISIFLLDRTRDKASIGLWGIFKRIDDRIERSRTAEDVDDVAASGQPDAQAQQEPVGEHEEPGPLQDRNEVSPDSPA